MDSPSPGLETLLARLAASGTEFVLVGPMADLKRGATDAKGRLALAVIEATLQRSGAH